MILFDFRDVTFVHIDSDSNAREIFTSWDCASMKRVSSKCVYNVCLTQVVIHGKTPLFSQNGHFGKGGYRHRLHIRRLLPTDRGQIDSRSMLTH